MILESQESHSQEIIQLKSLQKLTLTLSQFTQEILNQFRVTIEQVSAANLKKVNEHQEMIKEKDQKIKSLTDWIAAFTQHMQGASTLINGHKKNDQKEVVKRETPRETEEIKFGTCMIDPILCEDSEVEDYEAFKQKTSQLNKRVISGSEQNMDAPNEVLKPKQSKTQSSISHDSRPQITLKASKESKQSKQERLNKVSSQQINRQKTSVTKPPLQSSRDHHLTKITMTPNIKKLKYIQHYHDNSQSFSEDHINALNKFDLTQIQSVVISDSGLQNNLFEKFSKMNWENLKSLRIEANSITDIRPLQNLDLRNFEDLDVSLNPLTIESAQFLSQCPFDRLIYFTLSFDTGLDEECWEKLLQNNLNNFPRLQALDICNSNQLTPSIRKKIEQCLKKKSIQQKRRAFQKYGQEKYPQNYEIKISWNESKQIFDTYSKQKKLEISKKWVDLVNFTRVKLERLIVKTGNVSGLKKKESEESSKKKTLKEKKIRKDNASNCEKSGLSLSRKQEEKDADSQI